MHNAPAPQAAPKAVADLKCAVSSCASNFHTVKELVSHLNGHIGEGRSVSRPVSGCKHVFTKKKSFTPHMCRKHKACSPDGIDDTYRETHPQPPNVIASTDDSENTHEAMPRASAASDMAENDSQSYALKSQICSLPVIRDNKEQHTPEIRNSQKCLNTRNPKKWHWEWMKTSENVLLHTSGRNSEEFFTVKFMEEYTVRTVCGF